MKLMSSGRTQEAAMIRSPSFSPVFVIHQDHHLASLDIGNDFLVVLSAMGYSINMLGD